MTVIHSVLSKCRAPWYVFYTRIFLRILKVALGSWHCYHFADDGHWAESSLLTCTCLLYSHNWKVQARILSCPGIACTRSGTNW